MSLQRTESKRTKPSGRGASPKFLYRKQVRLPARATIRLGMLSVKQAEEIGGHIDRLVDAKRTGTKIDPSAIDWLKVADKKLIAKLVKLGLCQTMVEPTVPEFVNGYINGRLPDWAENTVINFRQLEKLIKERFEGRLMTSITRKDAMDFYNWLRTTKKLSENTARRFLGRSREMFLEAVEQGIIQDNPFKTRKLKVAVGSADKTYIDEATINEVIKHCPTTEWKLLFVFARYVGCRMPSEIENLKWDDINAEKGTILITSPKTKRYGKGERLVPLFSEVAGLLSLHHLEVDDGEVYVFPKLRLHSNLSTTARKYVKAAGILPWSEFWNSLRASRETDLMDSHGPNDACRWIGNTLSVAARHYQLMKKESYSGRIEKSDVKSVEYGPETSSKNQKATSKRRQKTLEKQGFPAFQHTSDTPNRNRTCD